MKPKGSATKRLIKIFGFTAGLIVLLAIAAKSLGWLDSGETTHTVETARSELRTITQIVSASGKMQPETEVIIRPDVSGEIIELTVREGDFVREDDLLLRIKPDIYQANIDQLNAALLTQRSRLEQARASMLQAQMEYETRAQLFERNSISRMEYMQSKNSYEAEQANFKAAEYQIESAEAQLRRAEEELQQTVIRSPADGTISLLAVERGERVLGQAQTAGTEMMRIARMDQMEVEVDVNENDIVSVAVRDTADIEVDAYPDRVFQGVITEIANSAQVTGSGTADQVTNYKVKIRVSTPHNLDMTPDQMVEGQVLEVGEAGFVPNFKPGMSATVDIRTETAYNVVSVPIQAVTVREDEPEDGDSEDSEIQEESLQTGDQNSTIERQEEYRRVVFVVEDGIARMHEVSTGISDSRYIQIQSGIPEGVEVVTGSYRILSRELADGDLVEVSGSGSIYAQN
ncbi:MAG: efflux RND transporter periplasmic adaptor subunit [Balneolaceae bacterium]